MPSNDELDRTAVNVAAINVHSAAIIFVNLGGRADLLSALVDCARKLVYEYDHLGRYGHPDAPVDRRLYRLTDDERHAQLHALAAIEHGQRWATSCLDAFHRVHGCDRATADGRTD